jgi:hypothetical protein
MRPLVAAQSAFPFTLSTSFACDLSRALVAGLSSQLSHCLILFRPLSLREFQMLGSRRWAIVDEPQRPPHGLVDRCLCANLRLHGLYSSSSSTFSIIALIGLSRHHVASARNLETSSFNLLQVASFEFFHSTPRQSRVHSALTI